MEHSTVIHNAHGKTSKPKLGLAFAIIVVLGLLMVHSVLAGPFFFLVFAVLAILMVPAIIFLRHEDKKQKELEKHQQS